MHREQLMAQQVKVIAHFLPSKVRWWYRWSYRSENKLKLLNQDVGRRNVSETFHKSILLPIVGAKIVEKRWCLDQSSSLNKQNLFGIHQSSQYEGKRGGVELLMIKLNEILVYFLVICYFTFVCKEMAESVGDLFSVSAFIINEIRLYCKRANVVAGNCN